MTDQPVPPIIPGNEELYDQLMSKIEPELVSGQIDGLSEKYKDESPEEEKNRMDKYNKAFAEYEKQLGMYVAHLNKEAGNYRKAAYASAENESKKDEQNQLSDLESIFSS